MVQLRLPEAAEVVSFDTQDLQVGLEEVRAVRIQVPPLLVLATKATREVRVALEATCLIPLLVEVAEALAALVRLAAPIMIMPVVMEEPEPLHL